MAPIDDVPRISCTCGRNKVPRPCIHAVVVLDSLGYSITLISFAVKDLFRIIEINPDIPNDIALISFALKGDE